MAELSSADNALSARVSRVLHPDNLHAWCIVPYDAAARGPAQRASLLSELGIRRLAWDWREQHLLQLPEEHRALQDQGLTLSALWAPAFLDPARNGHLEPLFSLAETCGLSLEFWVLLILFPEFDALPEEEKVRQAAQAVRGLADRAKRSGSKVALYNHGGWFGLPASQAAIIRAAGADNVGMVYNFHHAHEHIPDFEAHVREMLPHLMAVNLNGMRPEGPKILSLGQGTHELPMLRSLLSGGYDGPIGLINHREEMDAGVALRENLSGLHELTQHLLGEAPT